MSLLVVDKQPEQMYTYLHRSGISEIVRCIQLRDDFSKQF